HYAGYHTRRLLTNRTLGWSLGSRGYTKIDSGHPVYEYGDARRWMADTNAFFFRVLSELYSEYDPLLYSLVGASAPYTTWQDWKPVTGENAWSDYIGPIQTAWLSWGGRVGWTDPSLQLALDVLPAVEAMQCAIGAVYHVPTGVSGKAPNEISNENNFSLYAGLNIFRQLLENLRDRGLNLIRNGGFEEAGAQGEEDSLYWRWDNPDYHAGCWGNFKRKQWATHGGLWLGAIVGTWDGGPDAGGFWQDIPTRAGLNNIVTGWFKRDTDWTASRQEWKLEFYNGDYYQITAITGSLAGVGTSWGQQTLSATAPEGSVYARVVILAEGAGIPGALQIDDLNCQAQPLSMDITNTIARITTVITNQEHYFQTYLMNTHDGVFHTGGMYDTNTSTFTPYVFSGYWIGGPYRGSNIFSGTTLSAPFGYTGTNTFDGYSTVRVSIYITNDTSQVNIRYPSGAGQPEYIMTKPAPNVFTYSFANLTAGTALSFEIHPNGSQYGPVHAWTVQSTEPALPYTSRCTNLFAVDCQTWGMAVLGAQRVDQWFGEDKAYEIWRHTRDYGGCFTNASHATIQGVGFSDINNLQNDMASAEWTFGAILMCRNLARDYWEMGKPDLAQSLALDAETMRAGIESLKVPVSQIQTITTSPGSGAIFTYDPDWQVWGSPSVTNFNAGSAYLYASRRYEIPFGWWANPLPSLASSAWAIMTDHDFDPFVLGGRETNRSDRLVPWLRISKGSTGSLTITGSSLAPGATYLMERSSPAGFFVTNGPAVEASFLTTHTWSNQPASSTDWFRLRAME
ncbi:MAG: hypothetical protein V2A34_04925, partial [Lentisphaerota bacterium]